MEITEYNEIFEKLRADPEKVGEFSLILAAEIQKDLATRDEYKQNHEKTEQTLKDFQKTAYEQFANMSANLANRPDVPRGTSVSMSNPDVTPQERFSEYVKGIVNPGGNK